MTQLQLQTLLNDIPGTSPTMRGLLGIVTLIVGWGGWKAVKALKPSVILPLLDDVWMGSFTRNAARVEKHLRTDTFSAEIQMREDMYELIRATAQTTDANAQALKALLERELSAGERHSKAISAACDPIAENVAALHGSVEHVRGQLDILIRQRT